MARRKKRAEARKTSLFATAKPARSTRRRLTTAQKINRRIRNLSTERKLDILGVGLILVGLLSSFSLFTGQNDGLFSSFALLLKQLAGYGSFFLPVVLFLIGGWLVLRNENRLPVISAARLFGILLLTFNIFTWMHWFSGGGWQKAAAGEGGGYLGAFFERILSTTLGDWGGFVVLFAWFLIAMVLTFDISVPDLFRNVSHTAVKTKDLVNESAGKLTAKKTPASMDGFTSLDESTIRKSAPKPTRSLLDEPLTTKATAYHAGTEFEPQIRMQNRSSIKIRPPLISDVLNLPDKKLMQTSEDKERAAIIEETLASLGAPSRVVEIHRGPAFTQFCVEPGFINHNRGQTRVRVNTITSFTGDLRLALSARSIRTDLVPGKPYLGIEVPNKEVELVTLREGMESKSFQRLQNGLKFVLGKDVSGAAVAAGLSDMPHLLIAGTTGSGKSVCLNSILACYLLQFSPEELRLVLVDPKRVEFTNYNGIPHLLTPVVVNPEKVPGVMRWLINEMERRLEVFRQTKVRNIDEYNALQMEKMAYIILAIDELANLMALSPMEIETALNQLAQMSRATGIHIILSLQRPSVNILTGKIKANFPARISFQVPAGVDSQVIIDKRGADKLIGKGDMLFQSPNTSEVRRLQGVFVSNEEIQRIIEYWQKAGEQMKQAMQTTQSDLPDSIPAAALQAHIPIKEISGNLGEDEYLDKAIQVIRMEERASISLLQRKLEIGYMRAARLINKMEEMGIIGKPEPGSGVRPVLDFGDEEGQS